VPGEPRDYRRDTEKTLREPIYVELNHGRSDDPTLEVVGAITLL
jgi:hypothetical protein